MFKMTILIYMCISPEENQAIFGKKKLSTEAKIVNFIMRKSIIAELFKYTMSLKKYSMQAYSLFHLCNFLFLLLVSPVVHFSQWLINT